MIADNGVGIKEEDLSKVFQYGHSTKDRGSGFGMHNCANYLNRQGGSLSIESEGEHKGAKVIVSLPNISEIE